MPLTTSEILLKHVCPGLGVGIAFLLFSSPLKAVLEVNKKKSLGQTAFVLLSAIGLLHALCEKRAQQWRAPAGRLNQQVELNVLPFIAMAANCFAWIIYAYVGLDWYIYFGNIPGLMFGMFYVLTCYKYSKEQAQDALRNIFLAACLLFFVIGLVSLAAKLDTPGVKTLWGSTCVAILAVYYAAPLTSLARVVAQRDSSSLHWPLCCMNVINGTLWFAYGMALRDWFVGAPNGVGAAFNIVCVVFCFAFPAKGRSRLHGEVNPAANWGALRLQSARHPDTGAPGFESPATAGGFFDVAQFRWRGGAVGSFLRLPSGGSFGGGRRSSTAAATAGADAGMPAVLPVAAAQGSMAGPAEDAAEDCRLQGVDLVVVGGEEGVGCRSRNKCVIKGIVKGCECCVEQDCNLTQLRHQQPVAAASEGTGLHNYRRHAAGNEHGSISWCPAHHQHSLAKRAAAVVPASLHTAMLFSQCCQQTATEMAFLAALRIAHHP
ncbi:hypothetical protein COO60DRAFT_1631461 [Scenedesmus sp. NREL 46B-D3]|nr:hypothetical protein COO60DRAFT_1631461 [Scenedesmus sp. NREL 46B-D3]